MGKKKIELLWRTFLAISDDQFTHGYYKVTERVGEAFRDGLKLKK